MSRGGLESRPMTISSPKRSRNTPLLRRRGPEWLSCSRSAPTRGTVANRQTHECDAGRMVSALMTHDDRCSTGLLGPSHQLPCHFTESLGIEQHSTKRIETVGIEATRHNDDLRAKGVHRRNDDFVHRGRIGAMARPWCKGNVEVEAFGHAGTDPIDTAAVRREAIIPMQRNGWDARIFPEQRFGTLPSGHRRRPRPPTMARESATIPP